MRERAIDEGAVGCLINMVCVRVGELAGPGWDDLVAQAAAELSFALSHRQVTVRELIRELHPARTGRTPPIYQTICVLQNNKEPLLALTECAARFHRTYAPDAPAQLVVNFCPAGDGGMRIDLLSQRSRVADQVARALADDLFSALAAGPGG